MVANVTEPRHKVDGYSRTMDSYDSTQQIHLYVSSCSWKRNGDADDMAIATAKSTHYDTRISTCRHAPVTLYFSRPGISLACGTLHFCIGICPVRCLHSWGG